MLLAKILRKALAQCQRNSRHFSMSPIFILRNSTKQLRQSAWPFPKGSTTSAVYFWQAYKAKTLQAKLFICTYNEFFHILSCQPHLLNTHMLFTNSKLCKSQSENLYLMKSFMFHLIRYLSFNHLWKCFLKISWFLRNLQDLWEDTFSYVFILSSEQFYSTMRQVVANDDRFISMLSAVNILDQVKLDNNCLERFFAFTSFPPTSVIQTGKYISTTYLMIKITWPA